MCGAVAWGRGKAHGTPMGFRWFLFHIPPVAATPRPGATDREPRWGSDGERHPRRSVPRARNGGNRFNGQIVAIPLRPIGNWNWDWQHSHIGNTHQNVASVQMMPIPNVASCQWGVRWPGESWPLSRSTSQPRRGCRLVAPGCPTGLPGGHEKSKNMNPRGVPCAVRLRGAGARHMEPRWGSGGFCSIPPGGGYAATGG